MRSPGFLLPAAAAAVLCTGGLAHATTITEFPLPNAGHRPVAIAAAPSGSLWFSEHGASALGSGTLAGAITETGGLSGATYGIAAAPSGDIWATENPAGEIAQLTAGGTLHEYSAGIPHNGQPQQITPGPGGQTMWFTQWTPSKIASIDPTGQITEYGVPNQPWGITTGPDGNLWFTEYGDPGAIGRLNPATHGVTEFRPGLTSNSRPTAITAGPDGNLWFTETANPGRIGRITPTGTITEYTTGLTPNSDPDARSPPDPTATCGSPSRPTRDGSAGSPPPARSRSTPPG